VDRKQWHPWGQGEAVGSVRSFILTTSPWKCTIHTEAYNARGDVNLEVAAHPMAWILDPPDGNGWVSITCALG